MAKRAAPPVPDILDGYVPGDPSTLDAVEVRVRESMKLAFLQMTPTLEQFIRLKNNRGKTPRTRLFEAGNQSRKTTGGVAEDIAHMFGFRPWLDKNDPDYRIPIRVPNQGIVGCEV